MAKGLIHLNEHLTDAMCMGYFKSWYLKKILSGFSSLPEDSDL